MSKILIIDDQPEIVNGLRERFELEGYEVEAAHEQSTALHLLDAEEINLVLLDVYWGEEEKTGLDILSQIRSEEQYKAIPVVVMTGKPDSQLTIEALSLGANDFICKPVVMEDLLEKMRRLLDRGPAKLEAVPVWENKFVCSSPSMIDLTKEIWRIAQVQADVLLTGETGTGKNLVAEMIHHLSPRKNKPFYTIECTSIPATLFESTLFGHEKGAFTDASATHPGRVEMAEGGILFLDEIGDLTLENQAKLLGFLGTKQFMRVGGNQVLKANVQIIIATLRDLEARVEEGKFRKDLYYRIKESQLQIPPLREHVEDIPLLVWYFLKKYNSLYGKSIQKITPEVFQTLQKDMWDGNVRQLQKTLKEAVRNCVGQVLEIKDFSSLVARSTGVVPQSPMSRPGAALPQGQGKRATGISRHVPAAPPQSAQLECLGNRTRHWHHA
jgi:DNA-binding NtrC family response regulator